MCKLDGSRPYGWSVFIPLNIAYLVLFFFLHSCFLSLMSPPIILRFLTVHSFLTNLFSKILCFDYTRNIKTHLIPSHCLVTSTQILCTNESIGTLWIFTNEWITPSALTIMFSHRKICIWMSREEQTRAKNEQDSLFVCFLFLKMTCCNIVEFEWKRREWQKFELGMVA